MFRAHRRHHYDSHYDLTHSQQVHRRRKEGDRHVLLDVRRHIPSRHAARLGCDTHS